ncbi:MAG: class II aldolase/adducin family protein [Verrucomicrobiota bacterium]|nr:class II aldolase/adducin family protein [Verrucomicrobiota bacterium]
MENRWNDKEAKAFAENPKELRVYSSRLLGQEQDLVLHGGGNTSLKLDELGATGNASPSLFVKGSGWDLEIIETAGFSSLHLDALLDLARLEKLADSDMVQRQREAMLNSGDPNPSVEAILHAIIPFCYVDHTHADAVLAIMNTENGKELIKEIYGDRILIIPYVMPGFKLARMVYERTRNIDWSRYEGMMLMHHGVFTFSNDAHDSYSRMIEFATRAEAYLQDSGAEVRLAEPQSASPDSLESIRQSVSGIRGRSITLNLDQSPDAVGFSNHPELSQIATRGPLTPDHSIFAKRIPVILQEDFSECMESYSREYKAYFERNTDGAQVRLDSAPRWAIWPGKGLLSFGSDQKEARTIIDIARHTTKVIQLSEHLGGWKPLSEADIFEVEYWELEQAKLGKR